MADARCPLSDCRAARRPTSDAQCSNGSLPPEVNRFRRQQPRMVAQAQRLQHLVGFGKRDSLDVLRLRVRCHDNPVQHAGQHERVQPGDTDVHDARDLAHDETGDPADDGDRVPFLHLGRQLAVRARRVQRGAMPATGGMATPSSVRKFVK